jgi:hypothetical protein
MAVTAGSEDDAMDAFAVKQSRLIEVNPQHLGHL